MKCIWLGLALCLLSGCAYNPKVVVYGSTTGKQYIAPDLCGAIVACRQANETQCLYTSTQVTSLDGQHTESYSCKTVATK